VTCPEHDADPTTTTATPTEIRSRRDRMVSRSSRVQQGFPAGNDGESGTNAAGRATPTCEMAAKRKNTIERVRRAGGQRPLSGRPDGFVIAVVALALVGVLLVALARRSKVDAGVLEPVAGQDHWYEAFGAYDCDHYLPHAPAVSDPASGIGPSSNGLISVAPTNSSTAGAKATFGKFADSANLELTSSSFTWDGKRYDSSAGCTVDGHQRRAELVLYRWPPQASDRVTPTVARGRNIAATRFTDDRAAYSLAIVPLQTATVPLPATVDALTNPTDTGP
jgi:hypothetical protein